MINPRNSHSPLPDDRRKRCPVCRQTVYSSAGIHPQCAIKQADPWLSGADPEASAPEEVRPVPVADEKPAPQVASRRTPAPKRKVKQA